MSQVVEIKDQGHLEELINTASQLPPDQQVIVIDFYANWCNPCKTLSPLFDQMSQTYVKFKFARVNVDTCETIASHYSIEALPTVIFIRNSQVAEKIEGLNLLRIKEKLTEYASGLDSTAGGAQTPGGPSQQPALTSMLNLSQCECLNESNQHPLSGLLSPATSPGAYMLSDTDEQNAPKHVKLFVNLTSPPDFDACETGKADVELELEPKDVEDGAIVPLNIVKFQRCNTLTIFVANNQSGSDVTRIDKLCLYGSPLNTTNMNEFKRVSGKAGEAHS